MEPVQSSNISFLGLDAETGKLRVQFSTGVTYEYPDVPQAEYDALVAAPSIGSHFAKYIKPNHLGVKVKTVPIVIVRTPTSEQLYAVAAQDRDKWKALLNAIRAQLGVATFDDILPELKRRALAVAHTEPTVKRRHVIS